MGDLMTRVYRKGVLQTERFPMADVSEYLEQPDTVVWVDLCEPSKGQLDELAGELGLHELAVEDALGPHQRPKLDRYATHLFLSCHAVRVDPDGAELGETEIDAFINARWLITVRKNDAFPIGPVLHRWDRSPDLAEHGVSFLLYGLLDVIVDSYFEAIERFDEYYEEVSEGIFADQPLDPSQQHHCRHAPGHGPLPSPRSPHAEAISSLDAVSTRPWPRIYPTSRTCTTTSCAPVRRPTHSVTSSARSSRRTSACGTTART
jgi:Mg2+ and Co2+ transporter CorA